MGNRHEGNDDLTKCDGGGHHIDYGNKDTDGE